MKTDRVTDAAVEVRELTRSFGPLRAVNELSLSVQEGELFGLVGPDGAGKTTTLRMLAGVLLPSSGDASIFGVSVARDPEGVKHEIAYMSQRFGLYADLTVSENLRFYADLYQVPAAERPARLKRLFHFSGLEPFQGRLAGKLSGGMKQKLGCPARSSIILAFCSWTIPLSESIRSRDVTSGSSSTRWSPRE